MKWIKYRLYNMVEKSLSYCEANLAIAKKEAYEGKYNIEDDGQEEPVAESTADDVLNAMLGVM